MDVKESFRVLELELGASRAAVDEAFCRLLEHWHPDRVTPAGDPAAIREAARMVQAVNEAYQTLIKIVPPSGAKPAASVTTRNKPTLETPTATPATIDSPPARVRPTFTPPPPPPRATPPPAFTPNPPTPPPPPSVPAPDPPARTLEAAPNPKSASAAEHLAKAKTVYDKLFPPGTPQRRWGPVAVAVPVLIILLLAKCAISTAGDKITAVAQAHAEAKRTRTTGVLLVKSNRPEAAIEASRIVAAGEPVPGSAKGALGQALSGLTPGKYAVTLHADGWLDAHGKVDVSAGQQTEVTINFKSGSLRLNSDPDGATVRLGETVLGRTPLVIPQLPPGECELSIEYPSWPAASFKTTITENVESTGMVRLPYGKLTVDTTPPGTTVILGGKSVGQTPLTLAHVPAGTRKLTLQAKDFPPLEVSFTMEDRGEVKIHPTLGSAFPALDPAALLHAVWVPDNPDNISPPFEGLSGPSKPQNGVIRNLDRKRLYEFWLRKRYCFTGIIKAYDKANGQIEFAEQQSDLSKYRVVAKLSTEAHSDQDLTAQLNKGATFALYGRLSAVEEPRWPFKVITFELTSAEALR